jgi:hypothetical protein
LGARFPCGSRACLPWGSSSCRALYVGWPVAYRFTTVSRLGAAFRPVGDASIRPSPDPFGSGSFSRAFRPLRSSFSGSPGLTLHNAILAYRIDAGGHSYQDFAPHRDITSGVHGPIKGPAGIPSPASFRPRAFSAPRRFSPPPASQACFIPLPRPGFVIRPGDFSRFAVDGGSSPSSSPMPLGRSHSPASRLPHARPSTSRLHSANRYVPRTRRLDRIRSRSPLRVLSFPRDQLDHREPRVTGAIRSWRSSTSTSHPLARDC